jgi:hypothetical protein
MAKLKILLVSMLAVFAFAVVASSASAAEVWRVDGTPLKTGALFTIDLTAALSAANKLTWQNGAAEISCETVDPESAWIAGPSASGAKSIVFRGCTVSKPANCAVTGGSISTGEIRGHLLETKPEVTFEPTNGVHTFAEFRLENSGGTCSLNGKKLKIKGKANGKVLNPFEETVLKEISFATGAGELTIGASETEQEDALLTGIVSLKLELENFTWGVL